MAESIVQSLFGLTPQAIRRQEMADSDAAALQFAQLNPFQRANMQLYQAGGDLARAGAGLIGLQNPQEAMAQQQQQIQSQIDHSTPEGLLRGAELFNRAGNTRMAFMYQQAAAARQGQIQEVAKNRAAEIKNLAEAEKALRANPNLEKIVEGIPNMPGMKREVLIDKNTGKRVFEGQPYSPTTPKTDVKVSVAGPNKVTEFSNEYDKGVQPALSVLESARLSKTLINEASKSNNSQAWEASRTQIAKAVGETKLSNEDIRRVGVDPRLVQGALDWVNKKIVGVPNEDIMKQLYALSSVLEKNAAFRINQKADRVRGVAKQAGVEGDYDVLFPRAEAYTGKPAPADTGNVIDFNNLPRKPR